METKHREIKYRFWSGEKMFYDQEQVMECLKQQVYFDNKTSGVIGYDHMGLHGARFLQFTGRHDKNGKEIYEGDFVKLIEPKRIYTVEFKEFTYKLIHAQKDCLGMEWGSIQRILELGWQIEVIGNIFSTPDLIN